MTATTTPLPEHVRHDLRTLTGLISDREPDVDPASVDGVALEPDNREDLVQALYRRWYVRRRPLRQFRAPGAVAFDPPRALRAVHPATGRFEPGWEVEQASTGGRVVAVADGRRRLLDRIDYLVADTPTRRAAPGDEVLVTARIDELDDRGGFWATYHPDWSVRTSMVRVYWRVTPAAAPRLVDALARSLSDVPHAFKVARRWEGFARGDAAVLYVDRDDWELAASPIAGTARLLSDALYGQPPRLVRPLRAGVGVAEGAGDGTSFGQHRCALVVDGLLRWAADRSGEPIRSIAKAFEQAGLSIVRPHLDAGHDELPWSPTTHLRPAAVVSQDRVLGRSLTHRDRSQDSTPDVPGATGRPDGAGAAPGPVPSTTGDRFLRAAAKLGDELCEEAIWYEDRCCWLGAASERIRGEWKVVERTTGGELYEGTAGIGLFLARLASLTGSDEHRRTAVGAFAHAARWARAHDDVPLGLHVGLAGIVWATREAARCTDDATVGVAADELTGELHTRVRSQTTPHSADLIDGTSGLLLALHALDEVPADAVRTLTAALRDAAVPQPVGVAWPGMLEDGSPPLCGLGHGASGPALALLEVARDECDEEAAAVADAAMAYERSWFDRRTNNWPDLRGFDRVAHRTGKQPATPVYWCHGAVGIGLQRLRAWELTGAPLALADVGAARHACEAQARRVLQTDPDADPWATNVSVCHGVSGVAGFLIAAGATLGDGDATGLAVTLGEWMLDTFVGGRPWSCGVAGGGRAPGLLLGLSGVGLTLLQLADPAARTSPVGLAPVALGTGAARMLTTEDPTTGGRR